MNRTITLHVDIESRRLLDPVAWLPLNEVPTLKRGDTVAFEVNFWRRKTDAPQEFEAVTLATAGAYFVGMKVHREFQASKYLAQTETITVNAAKLAFTLALTSTELSGRLSGNTARVDAVLEIPYTTVEDGESTLASFRVNILNDYVKGTEGDPAPSEPTYYTAAQVTALFMQIEGENHGQKVVEASDGKLRLAYYFDDDDTWRVLRPVIVDGQPTLTWEDVTE